MVSLNPELSFCLLESLKFVFSLTNCIPSLKKEILRLDLTYLIFAVVGSDLKLPGFFLHIYDLILCSV